MEDFLVECINTFLTRELSSTFIFIYNLVIKILGKFIKKNWIICFVERHDSEFYNIYFNSIDYTRRVIDNSKYFEHYFELVNIFKYLN